MPLLLRLRAFALLLCFGLSGCFIQAPSAGDIPQSSFDAQTQFQGKALELAIAAEHGQTETIRRLIREEKINPDTIFASEAGIPLIAWPVYTRNSAGLKALLDNGANPNARRPEFKIKRYDDGSGGQYFDHENAMVYAAEQADPIYLKLLLEHGGDPNTHNGNDEPLLFVAFLKQNQWQNVKLLVEHGADVNVKSWSGRPIEWYSGRGGFEQTYWLLQHGADPTVITRGRDSKDDYMPAVANIYWHPGNPADIEWQRKCQHWLRDKGIKRPSMPENTRDMRKNLGFPDQEKDIPLL